MRITTKVAAAGIAGLLGVTGIAVLSAPVASATTTTQEGEAGALGSRLAAITEALAGLVGDGTLTQEQADEVAGTLDESDLLRGHGGGHGGRGVDLDAAAEVLGLTSDELRTALAEDGATLADVAAAQGVETSALVDALVTAGTDRLNQAVTDGRLTQEEADERIAALPERIAVLVEEELRGGGGHGGGPRGGAPGAGPDAPSTDGGATDGTTDDAATADGTAAGSA